MTRSFRFAVQAYSAPSGTAWRGLAKRVEDLGYSTLHVADHYIGPGPKLASTNHPVQELAAVPAIAVAAEATSSLRVGSRLFCVGYHHPVVLAKTAATLQLLSDGRFEFGIGAGWLQAEYEAMGIDFPPAGRRIDLLAETLDLVDQYSAGADVDVQGTQVQAGGFAAVPVPSPRPPVMVGGGARRVLTLAGRRADIVSINFDNRSGMIGSDSITSSTAERTAEKIGWIRDGAGERFDDVELEIGAYFTAVDGGAGITPDQVSARIGLDRAQLAEFPHALVGSIPEICDLLQRRRAEFGFSYVTVSDNAADDFAPVVAKLAGT